MSAAPRQLSRTKAAGLWRLPACTPMAAATATAATPHTPFVDKTAGITDIFGKAVPAALKAALPRLGELATQRAGRTALLGTAGALGVTQVLPRVVIPGSTAKALADFSQVSRDARAGQLGGTALYDRYISTANAALNSRVLGLKLNRVMPALAAQDLSPALGTPDHYYLHGAGPVSARLYWMERSGIPRGLQSWYTDRLDANAARMMSTGREHFGRYMQHLPPDRQRALLAQLDAQGYHDPDASAWNVASRARDAINTGRLHDAERQLAEARFPRYSANYARHADQVLDVRDRLMHFGFATRPKTGADTMITTSNLSQLVALAQSGRLKAAALKDVATKKQLYNPANKKGTNAQVDPQSLITRFRLPSNDLVAPKLAFFGDDDDDNDNDAETAGERWGRRAGLGLAGLGGAAALGAYAAVPTGTMDAMKRFGDWRDPAKLNALSPQARVKTYTNVAGDVLRSPVMGLPAGRVFEGYRFLSDDPRMGGLDHYQAFRRGPVNARLQMMKEWRDPEYWAKPERKEFKRLWSNLPSSDDRREMEKRLNSFAANMYGQGHGRWLGRGADATKRNVYSIGDLDPAEQENVLAEIKRQGFTETPKDPTAYPPNLWQRFKHTIDPNIGGRRLLSKWNTAETALGDYISRAKIGPSERGPAFKGYYEQAMAPVMQWRNIALYGGLAALAGGTLLGIRALVQRNRRKRQDRKADQRAALMQRAALYGDDPRLRFVYSNQ